MADISKEIGSLKKKAAKAGKDLVKSADHVKDAVTDGVSDFTGILKDAEKTVVDENTRSKMFQKICALIPNGVSNDTVLHAFELLRKQQKLIKKDFTEHIKKNKAAFEKHGKTVEKNKGYIEDQNSYTDMAYGDSTMQYSGCEIFATFNAIHNILGKQLQSLPEMIASYEKDGMVLSGKFGTSPKAISDFLKKQGFQTEISTDDKKFDEIGKRSDSVILTMYNDKDDISQQVHTVNISKKDGVFTAHNVYCNGKVLGPFNSISETIKNINKGKAKGISLIGIKKA